MDKVLRFSVSLEEEILKKLDNYVKKNEFPNRSQAIRRLIIKEDIEEKWKNDEEVAGAIVLVYDHHKRDLQNKSLDIQHNYNHIILSVQHVHLDHDICLETIALKGKANELKKLANMLISLKGVIHGQLVMTGM